MYIKIICIFWGVAIAAPPGNTSTTPASISNGAMKQDENASVPNVTASVSPPENSQSDTPGSPGSSNISLSTDVNDQRSIAVAKAAASLWSGGEGE